MRAFDLLQLYDPGLSPRDVKIHLAHWNGRENPLDVYFAGEFEEWQRFQTKKNFQRRFVLSLISMPGADQWLFAGVHGSSAPRQKRPGLFRYELNALDKFTEFDGRLVLSFHRPGRQSYLCAERWVDEITVSEILRERLSIGEFPGYRAVNLSFEELRLITRQALQSWRVALSNVAGVYLISDVQSGQLYVGSAYGEGGIWQRWSVYAENGHGGNLELRRLLSNNGKARAEAFRYSVLEVADIHTSKGDVLQRESHWKNVLLSRAHGLNAN